MQRSNIATYRNECVVLSGILCPSMVCSQTKHIFNVWNGLYGEHYSRMSFFLYISDIFGIEPTCWNLSWTSPSPFKETPCPSRVWNTNLCFLSCNLIGWDVIPSVDTMEDCLCASCTRLRYWYRLNLVLGAIPKLEWRI